MTVYETAPPSQGFLVLEQLNILEGFDLGDLRAAQPRAHASPDRSEEARFRRPQPLRGRPGFRALAARDAHLESPRRSAAAPRSTRRARSGPRRGRCPSTAATRATSRSPTAQGNAVSFIHSLSNAFGCGVVAGETGITLNNRAGRGFSLDPDHPNVIAPGRRTMHTLNAYMIHRNGEPWLIGGTPGGDQQTQWNTQVITNVIDHGMSLQDAIDAPRFHSFPGNRPGQPRPRARASKWKAACRKRRAKRSSALGHTIEVLGPVGRRRRDAVDRARSRARRAARGDRSASGRPRAGFLGGVRVPPRARQRVCSVLRKATAGSGAACCQPSAQV